MREGEILALDGASGCVKMRLQDYNSSGWFYNLMNEFSSEAHHGLTRPF